MKKHITKLLILIAACVLPLTQGRVIFAQDGPDQYQSFLPIIYRPGYFYLPLVTNGDPIPPWEGPVGGTIPAIVYDWSQPAIVYLASWDGGVYKSFDGGQRWIQKNNGLPCMQINTLAIDPNDPFILYAAPYRYGLYKSTDGGETWTSANRGVQNQAIVYSIAVDPSNSNNVYISTRNYDNPFHSPWQGILYKSTNGGASWSPSLSNAGGSGEQDWIYSIAIEPKNPSSLYAAGHETGAYRSTNSGQTWQAIDAGLSDPSGRSVVVDPHTSNPATLFLGVWHRSGMYISTDSGSHWRSGGALDGKIYSLNLDPSNPSTIFAATADHGLYRSQNAGGSWTNVGFDGHFFYTVAVNPMDSQTVLAGANTDGLWQSTDGGSHWSQVHWGFSSTASFTSQSEMPEPFEN